MFRRENKIFSFSEILLCCFFAPPVAAGIVGASCLQLVALAMEPKGGTPESPNTGHGGFFYDTDV